MLMRKMLLMKLMAKSWVRGSSREKEGPLGSAVTAGVSWAEGLCFLTSFPWSSWAWSESLCASRGDPTLKTSYCIFRSCTACSRCANARVLQARPISKIASYNRATGKRTVFLQCVFEGAPSDESSWHRFCHSPDRDR